nr:hypothetical protein [Vaginimicrobium propionicum]
MISTLTKICAGDLSELIGGVAVCTDSVNILKSNGKIVVNLP